MIRKAALATLVCLGLNAPAGVHAAEDGPMAPIVGALDSFRMIPDGVDWERYEGAVGPQLRCPAKTCGKARLDCSARELRADSAKAGELPPQAVADSLGDRLVAGAHPTFKMAYVQRFAPKTIGANPGLWAEFKAEGERPPVRYGLFVLNARQFYVAVNCMIPADRWDAAKPKIEALLARIEIVK